MALACAILNHNHARRWLISPIWDNYLQADPRVLPAGGKSRAVVPGEQIANLACLVGRIIAGRRLLLQRIRIRVRLLFLYCLFGAGPERALRSLVERFLWASIVGIDDHRRVGVVGAENQIGAECSVADLSVAGGIAQSGVRGSVGGGLPGLESWRDEVRDFATGRLAAAVRVGARSLKWSGRMNSVIWLGLVVGYLELQCHGIMKLMQWFQIVLKVSDHLISSCETITVGLIKIGCHIISDCLQSHAQSHCFPVSVVIFNHVIRYLQCSVRVSYELYRIKC